MDNKQCYGYVKNEWLAHEILAVLFKHKLVAMVAFVIVVVGVTAVSLCIDPAYIATTTFLVKSEREYLLRPEVGTSAPNSSGSEATISAAIQIITSRELAEKVIIKIGLKYIYPDIALKIYKKINPMDVAIMRIEQHIVVEPVNRSNIIKITFEHSNPVVAASVVNLLVEYYKDKHLKVFSDPHAVYLEQQLDDYAKKLVGSEDRLEKFKSSNRIYSLEEQRSLLSKQRVELDTSLKSCSNSIRELQGRLTVIRSQLSDVTGEPVVSFNPGRDTRISDTQPGQVESAGTFLKEQELVAKRKIRFENPLYLELQKALLAAEADLKSQSLKAQSLKGQVDSVDHLLGALNLNEQRLLYLMREKTVNEKNYQSYRERVDESRRIDDMNRLKIANISILQPATPPIEPSKPNKVKMVLLGILFGAVVGIGSAFASEYRMRTLSTPRQVERLLGVPVLLSIPYHEVQ